MTFLCAVTIRNIKLSVSANKEFYWLIFFFLKQKGRSCAHLCSLSEGTHNLSRDTSCSPALETGQRTCYLKQHPSTAVRNTFSRPPPANPNLSWGLIIPALTRSPRDSEPHPHSRTSDLKDSQVLSLRLAVDTLAKINSVSPFGRMDFTWELARHAESPTPALQN